MHESLLTLYIEVPISRWIERCRELKKARKIYQGAIERCSQQKWLDGSRSYRESIEETETFSIDQKAVEKLSRQNPESSMDRDCVNFCRERKLKRLDR